MQPSDQYHEVPNFDGLDGAILWAVLGAFAVVGILVTAALCLGAPAPLPRPAPPPLKVPHLLHRHLVGEWSMHWGEGRWDVTLTWQGDYAVMSKGDATWTGRWWVDSEGRLFVTEALLDDNGLRGCESRWSVLWDRDGMGRHSATAPAGHLRQPDGSAGVRVTLTRKKGK